MMSSWKWFWVSFLGGGTAFWISDVIIAVVNKNEQGLGRTIACPVVLILFYVAMLRARRAERSGPSTAIFAICGMWILAIWFTLLAQEMRAHGGLGFTWGEVGYVFVSSFLPPRVHEFVALEGSILGLWAGTLLMVLCHLVFETERWIVPPGVWAVFKPHNQRDN
jgi:hypothetical protein